MKKIFVGAFLTAVLSVLVAVLLTGSLAPKSVQAQSSISNWKYLSYMTSFSVPNGVYVQVPFSRMTYKEPDDLVSMFSLSGDNLQVKYPGKIEMEGRVLFGWHATQNTAYLGFTLYGCDGHVLDSVTTDFRPFNVDNSGTYLDTFVLQFNHTVTSTDLLVCPPYIQTLVYQKSGRTDIFDLSVLFKLYQ